MTTFKEWENEAEWDGDGRKEAWEAATKVERERCFNQLRDSKVIEEAILNERERCATAV